MGRRTAFQKPTVVSMASFTNKAQIPQRLLEQFGKNNKGVEFLKERQGKQGRSNY